MIIEETHGAVKVRGDVRLLQIYLQELRKVLAKPNPDFTWADLLNLTTGSLRHFGKAWWWVHPNKIGVPIECYALDNTLIMVHETRSGAYRYLYQNADDSTGRTKVVIPECDIIRIAINDAVNGDLTEFTKHFFGSIDRGDGV